MQIEECRLEGLECRYDAEAGRCVIPGCLAEASGPFEAQQEARWKERATAWALPTTKGSASERVSSLLAACQGMSPSDDVCKER